MHRRSGPIVSPSMTLMTGTRGPNEDPSELVDGLLSPVLEVADLGVVVALDDAMAESLAALSVEPPPWAASLDTPADVALPDPDVAESICG